MLINRTVLDFKFRTLNEFVKMKLLVFVIIYFLTIALVCTIPKNLKSTGRKHKGRGNKLVDFGAQTGANGSFQWFAEYPAS